MVSPFISAAATFPAFECCGCSMFSAKEVTELESMKLLDFTPEEIERARAQMGERPLHAAVFVCRRCGHLCCAKHFLAGLCYGCSFEDA